MDTNIVLAIGLVFIIEGFLPALFPNRWRDYLLKIADMPVGSIRFMGMMVLALGIIILLLNY